MLRGFFLTFVVSILNYGCLILTAEALHTLAGWSGYQFAGLYGLMELAAGLANVYGEAFWELPGEAFRARYDSTVEIKPRMRPRWGNFGRATGGAVFLGLALAKQSVAAASALLAPAILLLTLLIFAVSALIAAWGMARPDLDVVQVGLEWRGHRVERPLSLGTSLFQVWLAIGVLPLIGLIRPAALYHPAMWPSLPALTLLALAAVIGLALSAVAWRRRLNIRRQSPH